MLLLFFQSTNELTRRLSVQVSIYRLTLLRPVYFLTLVCVQVLSAIWFFMTPWTCSPPASSVHETFQARILEWVGISLSRESLQSRDWTWISCLFCIGRQILYYQHHLGWPYNLFCLQLCVSFICDILRELSLKLE